MNLSFKNHTPEKKVLEEIRQYLEETYGKEKLSSMHPAIFYDIENGEHIFFTIREGENGKENDCVYLVDTGKIVPASSIRSNLIRLIDIKIIKSHYKKIILSKIENISTGEGKVYFIYKGEQMSCPNYVRDDNKADLI